MGSLVVLACVAFIVHLFRADGRDNPEVTPALWVPMAWMFLAGSRYVTSWLSLGSPASAGSYDEGSPIDRAVFFVLLMAGLVVLYRRRLNWGELFSANKLLFFYLLYCLVSLAWSDEPFVAFKRWVKDLGNPVMAMVILTEPDPLKSLCAALRRLSFLAFPLSVLFIRYFPDLGRAYHSDGSPMFTGIGHQKNALGNMCLVSGIYFAWQLLVDRANYRTWRSGRKLEFWLLVAMLVWLLHMADSSTSLGTLVMVIGVLLASRLGFVTRQPERLVPVLIFTALALLCAETMFDLRTWALGMLNRRPDLTNRTELWDILFAIDNNSVVGAGFMSFWTGDRMTQIWARTGATVVQAHSGYVEQFLNLGYVGVAFIVLLMVRGVFGSRSLARTDAPFAHLKLCLVLAAAIYNYTEAAFYGVSNMWVLLLCGVIAVPASARSAMLARAAGSPPKEPGSLAAAHDGARRWPP